MGRKRHTGITDQRKASVHRLADARALFEKRRWRGAMYMAGYAVECRLKYKLMKMWNCYTLEELEEKLAERGMARSPFTHNLHLLLQLASGWERMNRNQSVWEAFQRVNDWQPSWRYSANLASEDEASSFLSATREVSDWIDNSC